MWAVYLCGCTDCFMHAMFFSLDEAKEYAIKRRGNDPKDPEGWVVKYVSTPMDIDHTDTGWRPWTKSGPYPHLDYYSNSHPDGTHKWW